MYNIFIPLQNKKIKSNIRGLWKSKENKIYYDYIEHIKVENWEFLENENIIEDIKQEYNQEAIFYIKDNIAYIYFNENDIEVLTKKIVKQVFKKELKKELKRFLKLYNGVTIYKYPKNIYVLESWLK